MSYRIASQFRPRTSRGVSFSIFATLLMLLCVGCDRDSGSDASTSNTAPRDLPAATPGGNAPVPSQPELAAAFESSQAALIEARTDDAWRGFTVEKQATLSVGDNRLVVTATGDDPGILLPPFAAGKRFIVQVTVDSPADTMAQLFYRVSGQPSYNAAQPQTIALKQGRNVIYFRVDDPKVIDPMRFDPGTVNGVYTVESMVARALAPAG